MRNPILLVMMSLFLCSCAVSTDPLTSREIEQRADEDLMTMHADQLSVGDVPITLNEAMARAIQYNLDHRLKMMEIALANKQLTVARYDLLPDITASAGYTSRSNDLGSNSQSLLDGTESLVSSSSQEKDIRTSEIKIVWNVLDFGVSYLRTKQQADQALIIEERRRKVVQNIIQDVRYAYWRAVCAEHLVKDMVALLDRSKSALKRSRQMTEEGLEAPKESLEYQRALLENIRMLWELIQRLSPAKVELASLMNLPPGTTYNLAEPKWDTPEVPGFASHINALEQLALISRPELRQEDYNARISALDVRKAMLQMLPGLDLQGGYNYDSNEFLYNKEWWNAGTFISYKIFNLFSGPAKIKAAKAQKDLVDLRRQAMSMAIMLQVRLAHQHYHLTKRQYLVNRKLDEINSKLNEQVIFENVAGRGDELTAIRSATNAMVARLRHYMAYAEMQNAAGRLFNSLGLDPLPEGVQTTNLTLMAETLNTSFERWDKLVNYLGEQSDDVDDLDDTGVASILAAFDKGLNLPASESKASTVSYDYDWLNQSASPAGSGQPIMLPPVASKRFVEQELQQDMAPDTAGHMSGDDSARVSMKAESMGGGNVLLPVDESLYDPHRVQLVSKGMPRNAVSQTQLMAGWGSGVKVPLVAHGFRPGTGLVFLPYPNSGSSVRVDLTAPDTNE
ncbi:MAG: TolC family protein [Desulfobulbaceae bacterium]|nr:TolC family protein [Desulfobulbaceae bacterium]